MSAQLTWALLALAGLVVLALSRPAHRAAGAATKERSPGSGDKVRAFAALVPSPPGG